MLVSKEVARLSKEKGFDRPTIHYFEGDEEGFVLYLPNQCNWNGEIEGVISRPTQEELCAWLRDRNVFVQIERRREGGKLRFYFDIDWVGRNGDLSEFYTSLVDGAVFYVYEEAMEAALKYCLNNHL